MHNTIPPVNLSRTFRTNGNLLRHGGTTSTWPKISPPPYQTVIYFPGVGSISQKKSENSGPYWEFDLRQSAIVKNGRAALYPIYKGTFERENEALSSADRSSHLFAEWVVKVVQDSTRCGDYLETRPDFDSGKLAYFGFSWGGRMGLMILAVESRLIAGRPLLVKDVVNANTSVFAKTWENLRNFINGVDYPWFLSDFIFKIRCPQVSMFDQRSQPNKVYFELIPDEYHEELMQNPIITETRDKIVFINDESLFWQKPIGLSQ